MKVAIIQALEIREGKKTVVSVVSGRSLIERERRRLLKLKKDEPDWWDSVGRSNWAREQFGPNLVEKNGEIMADGKSRFSEHRCSLCDRISDDLEEKMLEIDRDNGLSEGGEYVMICRSCLKVIFPVMESALEI